MTLKKFLHIISFIFLLIQTIAGQKIINQNSSPDRRDIIKKIDTASFNKFKSSYPITRDSLNKFPDSLIVEGKLVDYTIGISCGVFCGCGTLKIQLIKLSILYRHDYIYVGVPCLNILPNDLKKQTKWTLYKLSIADKSCFWTEVPMNKFDTKGLPFYILGNDNKK